MPVTAIAPICGRGGQVSVVTKNAASPAATMAPRAMARTKGTSVSLRIIVKFIARLKATPSPNPAPMSVMRSSLIGPSSLPNTEMDRPKKTMAAVTIVRVERASPNMKRDKIAAKMGTVATPIKTTVTGATAMARLNSAALPVWQATIIAKFPVQIWDRSRGPRIQYQIIK